MSLLGALLLAQAVQAPAQVYEGRGGPDVTVPRIEAEITVDGVLDEPAWAQAARLDGFWQYEPVDGRPAGERTEVLVWYSADAIHFGILAHDSEPGRIRATSADRDALDDEDVVTLYLDTFDDRRRAFFFAVNALGAQQDGVRTEGSQGAGRTFGGNTDKNPDFQFDSRGRVTPEGWQAEVRIPFSSLRYPPEDVQRWGINVERKLQRTGHTYTWTDARRANASFLGQSGALVGLHDLHRGIVVETQPFLTVSAPGERIDEQFERGDLDPEVGANLRIGFSAVSLDATVNPDFSQVESDEGLVTVNERFALFVPEKRPFFLEGIELLATPNQLVYTRRIADPLAGAKLTGKVGSLNVAYLSAVDENVDSDGREALFNIARFKRDLGTSSSAGFVYTDRSVLDGPDYNRVVAADTRVVFARLYYAEVQGGYAWTRLGEDVLDAPIWSATLDRTGRAWGFNYSLTGVGDEFVTQSGFVNRSGIVNGRAFNRLAVYGEPGALVERGTVFAGVSRIWDYRNFGFRDGLEGGENANFMFSLRGGWSAGFNIAREFVDLDPADYADYTVDTGTGPVPYEPLDRVSGPKFEANASTPTFRAFDADARVGTRITPIFQEGAEGREVTASATLNARPTETLRVSLSTRFSRLQRRRDDSEFARTIIPRLKTEFQPTRALLFRIIGEYRSERRDMLMGSAGDPLLVDGASVPADRFGSLRVDALVSFRPTPGTIAFFGYGATLAGDDRFDFDTLERTRDGFFLKLAYQFRN